MDVAKYIGFKMKKNKILIPTTFGSGSEVTRISVLTVDGKKTSFHDDGMFADTAIVDPYFIKNTPQHILKNSANYCLTISDDAISSTVALLSEASLSNEKIVAGECAVPGIIALIGAFNNKDYLNKLELNSDSKVLLFGCEGLTDKAMYEKLLDDGLKKI